MDNITTKMQHKPNKTHTNMDNIIKNQTATAGPLLIPISLLIEPCEGPTLIFRDKFINEIKDMCNTLNISLIVLLLEKCPKTSSLDDYKTGYIEEVMQWWIDKSMDNTYVVTYVIQDEDIFHDITVSYTGNYMTDMDEEDIMVIEETKNKITLLVDQGTKYEEWGLENNLKIVEYKDLKTFK